MSAGADKISGDFRFGFAGGFAFRFALGFGCAGFTGRGRFFSARTGLGRLGLRGFGWGRRALLIIGDVKTAALEQESAAGRNAPFGFLLVAIGAQFVRLGGDALEALEVMAACGAGVFVRRHVNFSFNKAATGQLDPVDT